jgi:hypothetical protein
MTHASRTRTEWVAEARALLDELRRDLGAFGVHTSPGLVIEADSHPCPGYVHDELAIRFCPPVVEGAVDRLRWTFFLGYMGCASLDEATGFYEVALPLVVAHELAHHVRISQGLSADSAFVEEQVCDRLAVAWVEASRHRGTLSELRERCSHMRARLDARFGASAGAGFVPDVAEALVVGEALARDELASLEAAADKGGLTVDQLVGLHRKIDRATLGRAAQARERARVHVEAHYTRDPAEYWHLSLRWIESWLSRARRPGLIEVVNAHLSAASTERERSFEVVSALEDTLSSHDPLLVEAAALGLLELLGGEPAHDLVDHAERAPLEAARGLGRALSRAWPEAPSPSWDPRAAVRLAARLVPALAEPHPEEAARLARLAGRATRHAEGPHRRALEAMFASLAAPLAPALARERRASLGEAPPTFTAADLVATAAWGRPEARERALGWALGLGSNYPHALGRDELTAVVELATGRGDEPGLTLEGDLGQRLGARLAAWLAGRAGELEASPRGPSRAARALSLELVSRSPLGPLDVLPARGGPAHRDTLELAGLALSITPASPRGALRHASLAADHAGVEPRRDPRAVGAAQRALAEATALSAALEWARAPRGAEPARAAAALLEDALVRAMRAAALEVVRALAPMDDAPLLARLAAAHEGSAPLPRAVRELFADTLLARGETSARPALVVRREVDALLAHEARGAGPPERGADAEITLAPPRLPSGAPRLVSMLARWLDPRVAAASVDGYDDATLRTLVERLVHLRAVPLFAHLEPDALLELAALTGEQSWSEGEALFREGERGERMYVLLVGRVSLARDEGGAQRELAVLEPPACFGEMALFDGSPRSATATALGPVRVLTLDGEALRRAGRASPEVYEALLRVLAARLRKR